MSKSIQIVKNFKAPTVPGKHFKLLCMTGPSKGTSYFLTGNRVVLGRSDKADVKVEDTKSSREHAELVKNKNRYVLSDLGSANGIVVNDLKVNQHVLADGDKIIIGATVYKYSVIKVKDPLEEEEEEYEESEDFEEDNEGTSKKSKKSLIMLLGLVAVFMILYDDGDEGGKKKGKSPASRTTDISAQIASELAKKGDDDDIDLQKKLQAIIHRGQREFREKNYFRAIEEFSLALVLDPNNGQASFYLNKTQKALDNEIEEYFLNARREYDSLKYTSSGHSYCAVMRLLEDYPDDERYLRAQNQIGNVEKALGLYEGEFKCFEE